MIPGKGVSQGHQEAHNTLNICRGNSVKNRANITIFLHALENCILQFENSKYYRRTIKTGGGLHQYYLHREL
jgi:hypothetical protein